MDRKTIFAGILGVLLVSGFLVSSALAANGRPLNPSNTYFLTDGNTVIQTMWVYKVPDQNATCFMTWHSYAISCLRDVNRS